MSKKKKHHHEDHVDESWLIPYADLLTLLLALFIVLFASSSVDAHKFQQMAQAFNSAFNGGTGMMEFPAPLPEDQPQSANKEDAKNEDNEKPDIDAKRQAELMEKAELAELQKKINAYINEKGLDNRLETRLTDDGLLITILNDVFFDSGRAEVRIGDENLAKEISELLVTKPPRNVVISGHTDNVPISTAQFESNWHLSVMRGVNFMKVILENENLDPRRFSVKGFGEFQPVATNDTAQGRATNRRVELLILPNEYKETN
ncbi:flagellar motor protein MotB [Bacillus suaedaesalsae]|uniref:Flagellar motor protein MotB n=1 Tax=Bacillus suaedaesalsae TaxID=2810349 RepID=A0ABS2DHW7_9BACI|nr:flagellar motor protein MotB [Bacillus suaedaesalsae]MBM6618084.1 flagellar motor protein MotB [Bacillus suaedaesalsae]